MIQPVKHQHNSTFLYCSKIGRKYWGFIGAQVRVHKCEHSPDFFVSVKGVYIYTYCWLAQALDNVRPFPAIKQECIPSVSAAFEWRESASRLGLAASVHALPRMTDSACHSVRAWSDWMAHGGRGQAVAAPCLLQPSRYQYWGGESEREWEKESEEWRESMEEREKPYYSAVIYTHYRVKLGIESYRTFITRLIYLVVH